MPSGDLASLQSSKQTELLNRRASQASNASAKTRSSAFGESDDLDHDLGLNLVGSGDGKANGGNINSNDEVSMLKVVALEEQLRSLNDENGRVLKLLGEKDFEIKKLKKKIANNADLEGANIQNGGGGMTNDIAASKIIELSKKLRDLTAELHKEQTKCRQLNKSMAEKDDELKVMQSELASYTTLKMTANATNKRKSNNPNSKFTSEESAQLKEKLDITTSKMLEYRASLETTKLELKKTQKALQSEVGEHFNVNDIVSGKNSASWRGRQQKIIELQQKLQEYKELVSNTGGLLTNSGVMTSIGTARSTDTLEDEMMFGSSSIMNNSSGLSTSGNATEDRNKAHIRSLEKKRQEEAEKLKNDAKMFEAENTRLQQVLDSNKARIKTLTNETKSLKTQIGTLKEKSAHDDELVTALMQQIDILKQDLARAIEAEKELAEQPFTKKTAAQEQVERAIVDQLKSLVSEKESRIKSLEYELSLANNKLANGDFTLPQLSSANQNRASQLPGPISNNSLCSSRPNSHNAAQSTESSSNQTNELSVRIQELQVLLTAASVEKDKLREFCEMLQKRVDEGTESRIKLDKDLSLHRKRCVLLEKQLGAAVSSGNQSSTKKSVSGSVISLRDSNAHFNDPANFQEMSVKCELLNEEIESLKANLQSIMKARDEDFNLYRNMIEETKNVFLTALRQLKQQTTTPS